MSDEGGSTARAIDSSSADSRREALIDDAVGDVDITLIDWALSLSPRQRLRAASKAALALNKFRHAPPANR